MIRTIGHGTAAQDEFVQLARGAGIERVVDVRRFPGSRRHPHFGRESMAAWLPEAGIDYRWVEALGGRRRGDPESKNVALRNLQFRAYADHMASAEFRDAVGDLLDLASETPTAVMCSESVWWRCHRRLLADHLVLLTETPVQHVMHDGRDVTHPVTEGARPDRDHVAYDGLLTA